MNFIFAQEKDYDYILKNDKHVAKKLILMKIENKEIIIIYNNQKQKVGWLRYGYFWDSIPFLNMIWIDEEYRTKGIGKEAILFWENEMKNQGYNIVMTSTLSNEYAQHFYRKLDYKDSGSLLLKEEPLEIIFTKHI